MMGLILTNMRRGVALAMDQYSEQVTILSFITTPHQTQDHTQILDGPTIHQLATVIQAHSHDHSWRVVTTFNQTKLKSFTKQPEEKGVEKQRLYKYPKQ